MSTTVTMVNHPRRAERRDTWTVTVALGGVLACILAIGGAAAVATAALYGMICALAMVALVRRGSKGIFPPWSPAWVPMIGFAGLVAYQGWFGGSTYAGVTRSGFFQLVACGAVFYLALAAQSQVNVVPRIGRYLAIFTGLLSAEAVAQYYSANGKIFWFRDASYGTPMGPFVYHNHYAGCIEMLLPITVVAAYLGSDNDVLRQMRYGLAAALAAVSIVISQSRGGLMILALEALLGGIILWPRVRRSGRLRRRLLVVGALLAAFLATTAWHPMLRRLGLFAYGDQSTTARLQVTRACLAIWHDHPWVGTGFNTFATIYPRYQRFDNDKTWQFAHDDYAQLLAETGLAGAVCTSLFLGLLLLTTWRLLRRHGAEEAPVCLAAAVGLIALAVHCVGDFELHSPANALLFFFLAGLVMAPSRRHAAPGPGQLEIVSHSHAPSARRRHRTLAADS